MSDMSDQKMWILVDKLIIKNESGEIKWERTPEDKAFQTSFTNYTVKISTRANRESPRELDYLIGIFNDEGTLIEETSDLELREFDEIIFKRLKIFYESARRKAFGVDVALDDLIQELS